MPAEPNEPSLRQIARLYSARDELEWLARDLAMAPDPRQLPPETLRRLDRVRERLGTLVTRERRLALPERRGATREEAKALLEGLRAAIAELSSRYEARLEKSSADLSPSLARVR